jgi:hypothetical protein
VVNELNVAEQNLTSPEDIAEGFNEYCSNIGPDLARKIDYSIPILKRMSKMLIQNLLLSNLLLSVMSLIFCMAFPTIKSLASITNLFQNY